MRKIFLLIFALSAVCGVSEAATIRLSHPKIYLEASPGETVAGEIVAENPTSEELKARVYLEDWRYTPGGTGEKKFSPAGTGELSASRWITFSPAETVLKPFGRAVVNYTVQVPPGTAGGYYSVIFFESILGSARDENGIDMTVAGRIGALFYVYVKGTVQKDGSVESVEIEPSKGNRPLRIVTSFRNSGNIDITVDGNFLIMDGQGMIVARGGLNKIYTFPGSTETGTTSWVGRLPEGTYQIVLTYDLGQGKELVVQEKTFTVR